MHADQKLREPLGATMTTELDLSIVVPVYNSAAMLDKLMARLTDTLSKLTVHYEIILVDDGSPDDSWAVMQALRKTYGAHLVAVQLMRN